ncbi:alpha/beta hydrolase [Nostoc sp. UHCC 0702]|nr:alpha/beta hydrolase [Nostoc sp. UHCC 0702]
MKKITWYAGISVILAIAIFMSSGKTTSSVIAPAVQIVQASNVVAIEHYISHKTTVPGFEGKNFKLHVREKVKKSIANNSQWNRDGKVVLFIHGYSISGVPTFDLDYKNYSWMNYLAERGFDTFAIDLTGYGGSTRPDPMNNPCNLDRTSQATLKLKRCKSTHSRTLTTIESDWDDIDAVVNHIINSRGVKQVSLIGASWGGVRAIGYASIYPEKIDKLIIQGAKGPAAASNLAELFAPKSPIKLTTPRTFRTLWNSMQKCQNQAESKTLDAVWKSMLASDPVGSQWGSGVVRSPTFSLDGAGKQNLNALTVPTLIIGGEYDWLASPRHIQRFYRSLKVSKKVHMTIKCASHFIPYERQSQIMYAASYDWLQNEKISGKDKGSVTVKANGEFDWN